MANKELVKEYIFDGNFGLEKESLRVNEYGNLSHTPHPFLDMPNIDRDFCENQIEIITDVHSSVDDVYNQLTELHNIAVKRLYNLESGKEYLWNFSNPPYVKSEEDIPIARFDGKLRNKEIYREYLASKYGRKKMLFSGIHFNFSFSDKYLEELYKNCLPEKISTTHKKSQDIINDVNYNIGFREFKDNLYLNLAKKVTKYGWLIVYLTAASPLMDGSFFKDEDIGKDILSKYASGRCSEIGYWNDFIPILDYSNLTSYTQSIQDYVDSGQLKSTAELYYPVRLKPAGENSLENLKNKGVNHIELRNIDLNPLSDIGLKKEDVSFLHLLIVYLSTLEDDSFEDFEQVMAIKNVKKAALFDDKQTQIETAWSDSENIKELTLNVLNEIEDFYKGLGSEAAVETIKYQKNKVLNRNERYVIKIMHTYMNDYVGQGLKMAEEYAKLINF